MLNEIKNIRYKLLELLFDEYYRGGSVVGSPKEDKRIRNLEIDVEYLSGKLMNMERILNRLNPDED